MPYTKLLTSTDIQQTALRLLEEGGSEGLSLRAVAAALGVKAPSLYRYFPDKHALEQAVAGEALQALATAMGQAHSANAERTLRQMVDAYLRFARERHNVYSFIMSRVSETYQIPVAKAVWNLLLSAVSGVTENPDDTAAAVAVWSFLHGYAVLEYSGAFGASGPQGALERGLAGFLQTVTAATRRATPLRSKLTSSAGT